MNYIYIIQYYSAQLKQRSEKSLDYININSFDAAVSKYSISNSSDKGGEIGWIKETMLSENLNKILGNMKKKGISKIIKYPNGYLIIKVNDKKEMKQIIDTDKELNDMINKRAIIYREAKYKIECDDLNKNEISKKILSLYIDEKN